MTSELSPISASTPTSMWSDLPLHQPDDPVHNVPTPPPSESPKSTTSSRGSSFNLPLSQTSSVQTAANVSDDNGGLSEGELSAGGSKETPKLQAHFPMPANIIGL